MVCYLLPFYRLWRCFALLLRLIALLRCRVDFDVMMLCWLLGTSVRENDMMPTMEQAFLPENPRGEYNQQGLYYSYARQHPYLNEGEVQDAFAFSLLAREKRKTTALKSHG
jgi:hypothetical protein